jgi:hypothetical protein
MAGVLCYPGRIMADNPTALSQEREWRGLIPEAQARAYYEIIGRHTDLPDGVTSVGLRFGDDHMGEPALWIVLKAYDDLNPSREKISSINRFTDKIREEMFALGYDRWPFIRIEAE